MEKGTAKLVRFKKLKISRIQDKYFKGSDNSNYSLFDDVQFNTLFSHGQNSGNYFSQGKIEINFRLY